MMYVLVTDGEEKTEALYNVLRNKEAVGIDFYPEPIGKKYPKQRLVLRKYSDINEAILMQKNIKETNKKDFVIKEWRTETGIGNLVG